MSSSAAIFANTALISDVDKEHSTCRKGAHASAKELNTTSRIFSITADSVGVKILPGATEVSDFGDPPNQLSRQLKTTRMDDSQALTAQRIYLGDIYGQRR